MEEPKLATSIDNRTKPDQGQVGQRTSDVKLIARVNARPCLLGNLVKAIGIAIFGFTSSRGSAEGTKYKHNNNGVDCAWTNANRKGQDRKMLSLHASPALIRHQVMMAALAAKNAAAARSSRSHANGSARKAAGSG